MTFIDIRRHPVIGVIVNHTAVFLAFTHVVTIETACTFAHFLNELVLNPLVYKEIVWSDACLSGIYCLAPNNTACSKLNIAACIDNARAFTAKLESQRCQILRRRFHHHLPNLRTACIKYHVKPLFKQLLIDITMSLHHSNILRLKTFIDNLLHHCRGVLRVRRRLQHRTTTRRYGSHQRSEHKVKRIVPWRDDKCHSVRLLHNVTL